MKAVLRRRASRTESCSSRDARIERWTVHENHLRCRTGLTKRLRFSVFVGIPPRLGTLAVGKFQNHETPRIPVTFENVDRPSPQQVPAAVSRNRRRSKLLVTAV